MDDFYKASTQTLEELADFFEAWPHAEVDLLEESLTITLPHEHQYLINKHGVTRQIWLSSPFTGAHHFQLKDGQWRCTRTDILLEDLLIEEQKIHAA